MISPWRISSLSRMTQISAKRDALAYNDSPVRKKEKWSMHLMLQLSERLEDGETGEMERLVSVLTHLQH